MYRILLLLTLACTFVFPTRAQYVRVNYDKKTVAAMVAAYGTETVAEAYYNEQVKAILERYNAAEIAAAGIFTSKFLDRKGLTELGIWSNQTENQYYRRIYHLVSAKIMPKIWTVAGMMLRSPQTALYWGSYLMKICTEVKTLCMQFESVVTNGSLSFNDIAFLQLNPQVASLFTLSENGGINWKTFLDDLGDIPHNFTKENLKADLDNLYNMGVNIATAGTICRMVEGAGGTTEPPKRRKHLQYQLLPFQLYHIQRRQADQESLCIQHQGDEKLEPYRRSV